MSDNSPDYIKWIRSKVGHGRILINCAGGWIENEQGQVLLQKRSPDQEVWGFPGGIMELGESAEEAAIREIKEETGLDVKVNYLIGVYTKYFHQYANGDKAQTIVFSFHCSIIGGELSVDQQETFDLTFFDPKDAPRLFTQDHRDLLQDVISGRRGVFR